MPQGTSDRNLFVHGRCFARLLSALSILATSALLLGCGSEEEHAAEEAGARSQKQSAVQASAGADAPKTALVFLKEKADLSALPALKKGEDRGRIVYNALASTAERSQASLRAFLKDKKIAHQPLFIVNAIRVTADEATLTQIESLSEVDHIVPDVNLAPSGAEPLPETGASAAAVPAAGSSVEWNLEAIRVPQVWAEYGVFGEGIVVANLGSGADREHPALAQQYRGALEGGGFDHIYSWLDAGSGCMEPCEVHYPIPGTAYDDRVPNGTAALGIMVGDDHSGNRVGIAPMAQWIGAGLCGPEWCEFSSLLRAAEWILAPRDTFGGGEARPDLRPHVVNTSILFYLQPAPGMPEDLFPLIDPWVEAGIFPVFPSGSGVQCGGIAGSLGDYAGAYAVGRFDNSGSLVDVGSARGPSTTGAIKPNITAPGAGVRSLATRGSYTAYDSEWIGSAHVAGTVALLWSASPTLRRDVAATRAILDASAVDVSDLTCGGTDGNNNVWGEGKLDALAAMRLVPLESAGAVTGLITDSAGVPVNEARVQVSGSEEPREVQSGSDGRYFLRLPVGTYGLMFNAFGYTSVTSSVTVEDGITTTLDRTLESFPRHSVSGIIRNQEGDPIRFASVSLLGTSLETLTGVDGSYSFPDVPEASYELKVDGGGCYEQAILLPLVLDRDRVENFTLTSKIDAFGYRCEIVEPTGATGTSRIIDPPEDFYEHYDTGSLNFPFDFPFYGQSYSHATVSERGLLTFLPVADDAGWSFFSPQEFPSPYEPNGVIAPFWASIALPESASSGVFVNSMGEAPNRALVVEWRDIEIGSGSEVPFSFTVTLHEDGSFVFEYPEVGFGPSAADENASIGIENETGTVGLQYSYNQPSIYAGLAIRFIPPGPETSPLVSATPEALEIVVGEEEVTTRTLELKNLGEAPLRLTVHESTDGSTAEDISWLRVAPRSGWLAPNSERELRVTLDARRLAVGTYDAKILVETAPEQSLLEIPVLLVVTDYKRALNVGGRAFRGDGGERWEADRRYTPWRGFGYVEEGFVWDVPWRIADAEDPMIYRSQRVDPGAYRFDVENGVYQVDLRFAELTRFEAGERLFDVVIEGQDVLSGYDIVQSVGNFTADERIFVTTVADGRLDVVLRETAGSTRRPVLNGIAVTHRIDQEAAPLP